ncbi:hypothetical protein Tco_0756423 [Tanacetum coccineum]
MEYLPQRRWSTLEKKRANIMIKAIDKQLKDDEELRNSDTKVIHNDDENPSRANIKQALVIMEWLVNISKRRAFWSLNEDILKITILKTNTPYPSRKIWRIESRLCPYHFIYPKKSLTMEEMLYKFIDEGKLQHEEMREFTCDFQTTNKLLFKERNNSLIELRFGVQELLKVMNNVQMIDYKVKGVTTRGGKTTTHDVHDNNTDVQPEEPPVIDHDKLVGSNKVLTETQPQKTNEPFVQPSNMPEDIKVPLILGRPFLSTARAKIDVYKRKITLRVGEERIVFTSVKPASSLIKRVYMLNYIELNDLNEPFELRRNQEDDLMPTIKEGEVIEEFRTRDDELNVGIDDYPSYCDYDKKIHIGYAHNLKFSCMIGFEFTHANFFPLL